MNTMTIKRISVLLSLLFIVVSGNLLYGSELSCEIKVLQTIEQKEAAVKPTPTSKNIDNGISLDAKKFSEVKFELFSVILRDSVLDKTFLLGMGSRESPTTRFDGFVGFGQVEKTPEDCVIEKLDIGNGNYFVCYQVSAGLAITHECTYANEELRIVTSWLQDIRQTPLRRQNVHVMLDERKQNKWTTKPRKRSSGLGKAPE